MKSSLIFSLLSVSILFIFMKCDIPLEIQKISHYIEVDSILKVEISNVYGSFELSEKQLKKFKSEFKNLTTEPELRIKTGSLMMIVTREDGDTYVFRGDSSSDYLEVSSDFATLNKNELENTEWLTFHTNGINFNNYKNK